MSNSSAGFVCTECECVLQLFVFGRTSLVVPGLHGGRVSTAGCRPQVAALGQILRKHVAVDAVRWDDCCLSPPISIQQCEGRVAGQMPARFSLLVPAVCCRLQQGDGCLACCMCRGSCWRAGQCARHLRDDGKACVVQRALHQCAALVQLTVSRLARQCCCMCWVHS